MLILTNLQIFALYHYKQHSSFHLVKNTSFEIYRKWALTIVKAPSIQKSYLASAVQLMWSSIKSLLAWSFINPSLFTFQMPLSCSDESSTESTQRGRVFTRSFSFTVTSVEHGLLALTHMHCLQTALCPLQEQHGILHSLKSWRDSKCVEYHPKMLLLKFIKQLNTRLLLLLLASLAQMTYNQVLPLRIIYLAN